MTNADNSREQLFRRIKALVQWRTCGDQRATQFPTRTRDLGDVAHN